MEWILKSPQIHSAFASLGYTRGDVYYVNENCNRTLEEILKNILSEDKGLRNYRRTVSFGQNVQKDLMPLLMHSKDHEMIGLLIKILMNLTIPVECLLSLDVATRSDFGRHTIFELRNLLSACKNAFVDPRATKVVIDYLRENSERNHLTKLSIKQCEHIHDCLTLLRNVLHEPDEVLHRYHVREYGNSVHNQIFWNMFSQGVDRLIIKLTTMSEASMWSVTMVQLVALLYKNQHVGKLQKLLNAWLDNSLTESSDDNESNTSPHDRGSAVTSPMLTVDQTTSDSSDNGAKGNSVNGTASDINFIMVIANADAGNIASDNSMGSLEDGNSKSDDNTSSKMYDNSMNDENNDNKRNQGIMNYEEKIRNEIEFKNPVITSNKRRYEEYDSVEKTSENQMHSHPPIKMCKVAGRLVNTSSDCGYATQMESREIYTSSNEDDRDATKRVRVKPRNPKKKTNTKFRVNCVFPPGDRRRKKIVKRAKTHVLNVKGLQSHQPTDDDITLVLKEFTVDFMLKGYSSLVKTLHMQILNNNEVEIDRCHFFWLITYFLKFATQMELDLEHVQSVLSFDVVSFLTAEGVNLCEQFDLAVRFNKADLNLWRRKLHLVVTAIREFVQAIDTFKRIWLPSHDSHEPLNILQMRMWETHELRSLMILLIRSYTCDYHDKQYLQDLVVTNHLLLLFLDNVVKMPGFTGKSTMIEHIQKFATPHMMWQYGVLLEDFETNGEFVNDCVFTIMHHVGGDVGGVRVLYQVNILHAFASIKQSEYEICDHWTDLVEYVLNSYARKHSSAHILGHSPASTSEPEGPTSEYGSYSSITNTGWTDDELSALGWNSMQSQNCNDVIGNIVQMYRNDGVLKTRNSVIEELYQQSIINLNQRNDFINNELNFESEPRDVMIRNICDELKQQGHGAMLEWLQSVLLDVCYAKICLVKAASARESGGGADAHLSVEFISKNFGNVVSPVAYHNVLLNKAIPLVTWDCEQAAICKNAKFLKLLCKLNFYMPVDSGMVFFRVLHTCPAEVLYEMALTISNVDTSKLKFSINDLSKDSAATLSNLFPKRLALEITRKLPVLPIPEHCYRIQRFKQVGAMVQYTPTPEPTLVSDSSAASTGSSMKLDWATLIKRAKDNKDPSKPFGNTSSPDLSRSGGDTSQRIEDDMTNPMVVRKIKKQKSNSEGPEYIEPLSAYYLQNISPKHELSERYIFEIPTLSDEDSSVCDTASVVSDFSCMYVSDEDEHTDANERRLSFELLRGNANMHHDVQLGAGVGVGDAYPRGAAVQQRSTALEHDYDERLQRSLLKYVKAHLSADLQEVGHEAFRVDSR